MESQGSKLHHRVWRHCHRHMALSSLNYSWPLTLLFLPSLPLSPSLGDQDPEPHSCIITLPSAGWTGSFQDTDLCESSPGLVGTLPPEPDLFQKLIFWHLLLQRKGLRHEDKRGRPRVCEMECSLQTHSPPCGWQWEWNRSCLKDHCHSPFITYSGSGELWLQWGYQVE